MHRFTRSHLSRFILSLFVLFVLFVVPASSQEPLKTAGDRPIDISHIRLEFKVDLPKKTVDAVATLNVKALRSLTSFALDAEGFQVQKVQAGGKDITFSHDGRKLIVDCEPPWPQEREQTLSIAY